MKDTEWYNVGHSLDLMDHRLEQTIKCGTGVCCHLPPVGLTVVDQYKKVQTFIFTSDYKSCKPARKASSACLQKQPCPSPPMQSLFPAGIALRRQTDRQTERHSGKQRDR